MNTKENIHSGHRQRLRAKVEKDGIYNLNDINYLEYLLTYVIPRADTNPTAHALLNEFMTLDGVLGASASSLKIVKGIGDKTAEFLAAVGASTFLRQKSKLSKNIRLVNLSNVLNFLLSVLPPSRNEQFIAVHLSKNYTVKTYKIFGGLSHSHIELDTKEITEFIIGHQSGFILFAHTHPDHNAKPSASDDATFKKMTTILNSFSCVLVDNLILGDKDFYSYKFNIYRQYSEIEIDYVRKHPFYINKKQPQPSDEELEALNNTSEEYIDF